MREPGRAVAVTRRTGSSTGERCPPATISKFTSVLLSPNRLRSSPPLSTSDPRGPRKRASRTRPLAERLSTSTSWSPPVSGSR